MSSGRKIFFDFLFHRLKFGHFFAVHYFLYTSSVLILYGNLSGNLNHLKIVFFLNRHCDKTLGNLPYFLSPRLCSNDSSVIKQCRYLISKQCLSLGRGSAEFSILCHVSFPFSVHGTSGHALWTYLPNVFRSAIKR